MREVKGRIKCLDLVHCIIFILYSVVSVKVILYMGLELYGFRPLQEVGEPNDPMLSECYTKNK